MEVIHKQGENTMQQQNDARPDRSRTNSRNNNNNLTDKLPCRARIIVALMLLQLGVVLLSAVAMLVMSL